MSSTVEHVFRSAPFPPAQTASLPPPDALKSTSTQLTGLPVELVDQICSYLETEDIHKVRLSCKGLYLASRRQFAVSHFQLTRVLTTRDGLETAITIAKNPQYGSQVKRLEICHFTFFEQGREGIPDREMTDEEKAANESLLEEFWQLRRREGDLGPELPHDIKNEDGNIHPDVKNAAEAWETCTKRINASIKALRRQHRRNYGRYIVEQYSMRKQGTDIELLVALLKILPALESIALYTLRSSVLPWGARKFKEQINWVLPPTCIGQAWANGWEEQLSSCSHAIGLVFGAIIRSGVRLKGSLTIQGAPYNLDFPEHSGSRRLAKKGTPASTFNKQQMVELKRTFAELKRLTLMAFPYGPHGMHNHDLEPTLDWIRDLIPMWSSLESLHITGSHEHRDTAIMGLLSSSNDVFPQLRSLGLNNILFFAPDLHKFIANHSKTLESLHIYDSEVYHEKDDYLPLLEALRHAPSFHTFEISIHKDMENPHLATQLLICGETPSQFGSCVDVVSSVIRNGYPASVPVLREHIVTRRIACYGPIIITGLTELFDQLAQQDPRLIY